MPSPSSNLPTWWINVWIALGTVTFLVIVILPMVLFSTFTKERFRFDQCEVGKRSDCKPSMIWYFSGWSGPTSTFSGIPSFTATGTSTGDIPVVTATSSALLLGAQREERTSPNAPKIEGIKVTGATLIDGVYQLPPARATKMHWTIRAEEAASVVLYTLKDGGTKTKPVQVLILKKQADGSFQGDWSFLPTPVSLEVRVMGANAEQQSLFFAVAPTP